jgi:hypothetical protein
MSPPRLYLLEWDSAEMSVNERSGDDQNSQAETVIQEIPPTGDLEQDVTDKGEGGWAGF